MELNGKKVIVTGGASGFGYALTRELVKQGAIVGVFDINATGLDELKKEEDSVFCVTCDITDPDQVEAGVGKFFDEFGAVDILVNNAGLLYSAPLVSVSAAGVKKHTVDMWKKVVSTNLDSAFYMTVNAVEKMILKRTKGLIINVSSVSATGNPGQTAYSAAKAGLNALTVTWSKELGPLGIRVAGIAPGYSDTQSTKDVLHEDTLKGIIKTVPIRRLGKVEEIVDGILFLINNDFFNGKVLQLDGGLVI